MSKNRFLRRNSFRSLFEIDQVKLVYFLSLIVGLLSGFAAALLKYTIHYMHKIITEGITASRAGLYLLFTSHWDDTDIFICKVCS